MIKADSPLYTWLLRISLAIGYVLIAACFFYAPRMKEYFFSNPRVLNVFTFSEIFTPESLRLFEQKYNVKVNLKLYDSNEELFAKFKITGGKGYDIIIPSDYMVQRLVREQLLAPLDYTKLAQSQFSDDRLKGHFFDPENKYSMPVVWVTYGILYKKDIFYQMPEEISLALLFAKDTYQTKPYKIAIFDDAIESVLLADIFITGDHRYDHDVDVLDDAQLERILSALKNQRSLVASYVGHDIRNFLFADLFQVAMTSSMNAQRIMQESSAFDFKIPQEGSLFVIENIAIPALSNNKDLAHLFIDFMISAPACIERFERFGANPVHVQAYDALDDRYIHNKNFFPNNEMFSRLRLTHNNLPLKKIEELWLQVKNT